MVYWACILALYKDLRCFEMFAKGSEKCIMLWFIFKRKKENWKETKLLFQFIFWCLHVAPSKAGGAQRSPRRQCERILSQSKCTISPGDFFFFLPKLLLTGNSKSDWFVLSSPSFLLSVSFLPISFFFF